MIFGLDILHGRMPDFISLPLFGLIVVIKLRNFDFESHFLIQK